MSIPGFFVLFLIFLIIFQHHLHKPERIAKKEQAKFWANEEKSLFVRKKNIESIDLIKSNVTQIPNNSHDFFTQLGREDLFHYQEKCLLCAASPMMNQQGLLNSELRFKYGTANMPLVQDYEENYNQYLKALYRLATGYYEIRMLPEAIATLEEGLNVGTDISDHFILLGKLYLETNNSQKFQELKQKANTLNSLTKEKILKNLDTLEVQGR